MTDNGKRISSRSFLLRNNINDLVKFWIANEDLFLKESQDIENEFVGTQEFKDKCKKVLHSLTQKAREEIFCVPEEQDEETLIKQVLKNSNETPSVNPVSETKPKGPKVKKQIKK